MREVVVVQTNDPVRPLFELVVAGKVEKFVEIHPQKALLRGKAGEPLAIEIKIKRNRKYPFKILEVRTERDDRIRARLVEGGNSDNNCIIRVENLKKTKGRYAAILTVHTDHPEKPSFPIFVVGIIQ